MSAFFNESAPEEDKPDAIIEQALRRTLVANQNLALLQMISSKREDPHLWQLFQTSMLYKEISFMGKNSGFSSPKKKKIENGSGQEIVQKPRK